MDETNGGGQQQLPPSPNGDDEAAGFRQNSSRDSSSESSTMEPRPLQRRLLELILAIVQPEPVSRREVVQAETPCATETRDVPPRSFFGLGQVDQPTQRTSESQATRGRSLIERLATAIRLQRDQKQSFVPRRQYHRPPPTATGVSWSHRLPQSSPGDLSTVQLLPSQGQSPPQSLNSSTPSVIPFQPWPQRGQVNEGTSDSAGRHSREQIFAFFRSLSSEQWHLLQDAVDCYLPPRRPHGNLAPTDTPHGNSWEGEHGVIPGYSIGQPLSLPVVERILEVLKSAPCLRTHPLSPNASTGTYACACTDRGGRAQGQTGQCLPSTRHQPVAGYERYPSHDDQHEEPLSSRRRASDVSSLLSDIQTRGTEPEMLASVVNILISSLIANAAGRSGTAASSGAGDAAATTDSGTRRDEGVAHAETGDDIPERPRVRRRREYHHEGFPRKLHRILMEAEEQGNDDIISFNPSGRAFQIHNIRRFSQEVIPRYFRHSKYSSFLRSLNLYGFEKLKFGEDGGAFGHQCFRKDRPELCDWIARRADQLPPEERVIETEQQVKQESRKQQVKQESRNK